MTVPKPPTGTYSARLRARREARLRPTRQDTVSQAPERQIQVGNWSLVDEDGALVVINRVTGARTVLMNGGG
jgi:hypothetical protein